MSGKGLPFAIDALKFINKFPGLQILDCRIYCTYCDINLVSMKKFVCEVHVRSQRHILNQRNHIPYSKFLYDFIFVFSASNVAQSVVSNENFKSFWNKYVPQWKLPSPNQIQYALPKIRAMIEENIKKDLKNKKVSLTVHETTNYRNEHIVNILVRELNMDGPSLPYLLSSQIMQRINAESMVNIIQETLRKFDIQPDQLLLLVTDEAAYMLETGTVLKNYNFPHLLHIICLLHTCHLVAETVRKFFPAVDKLIAQVKKVFSKFNGNRKFHETCPGIPLPPHPISTKCQIWIEAVIYYNKYWDQIKHFILTLNPQQSKTVRQTQQQFEDPQVKADLGVIAQNYTILTECITSLRKNDLSLAEALKIVENLNISSNDIPGQHATHKLRSVLDTNPDYTKLFYIRDNVEIGMNAFFKFANLTSYDAERSLSTHTFSPLRRRLANSNLEGLLIMRFYARHYHSLYTQKGRNEDFYPQMSFIFQQDTAKSPKVS